MNRTLKILLKVNIFDVVSMVSSALVAYALVYFFMPPAHPWSIFIGTILGNRIATYLFRRNDPEVETEK